MPSTEMPAVASSSDKEPSEAIAKRETAPSAKFVVKAQRSSGVTTAQQISLRPLPTEEVRATSDPSSIAYDDAAAAPFWAPKASVTMSGLCAGSTTRRPGGASARVGRTAP